MKIFKFFIVCLLFALSFTVQAQWPMQMKAKSGEQITVYQPQPESMSGNKITGRSAFSVKKTSSAEPIFGVFWFEATMATDRDKRTMSLEGLQVKEIKLPGVTDTTKINALRALLVSEIMKHKITASIDDITSTLEQGQDMSSADLKNTPPVIHYKNTATTLVLMDGEPILKDDEQFKMKRVVNTAFLIVQEPGDKKYYLYAGEYWYVSSSMTDGYKVTTVLPSKINELSKEITQSRNADKPNSKEAPKILVSTVPAELIQSKGPAEYANIEGTNLLYVSNSEDDIFKNVNDQNYYILISGRWYSSATLDGTWTYIASDKLPADFAKIPEGSEKDNVLSSVAGTPSSKEAIMDAQVPQTAKVARDSVTCTVKYDGEPKFEKIEGTSIELAANTSSTVMKSGASYFCLDNGIWFIAPDAKGPWKVSDTRPADVDKIPASSPAYNTQYVYIYETTPTYVYVGYTPGYMGCYVYGNTVVYGTGYYYNPWYGPYYYPRPATYGYSMHYNPWTGWSMGFHYSTGCFTFTAMYHPYYWGPPMYRPPYHPPYHGGMYGPRGPVYVHNDININRDNTNNIYNRNPGAHPSQRPANGDRPSAGNRPATSDRPAGSNNRPSTNDRPAGGTRPATNDRPGGGPGASQNGVYADRGGNVYQQGNNGEWQQRNNNTNQWENSGNRQDMNNAQQNRERSQQHNNSYGQMNRGGDMGGGYNRPAGAGGMRGGAGGGGMRGGGGRR